MGRIMTIDFSCLNKLEAAVRAAAPKAALAAGAAVKEVAETEFRYQGRFMGRPWEKLKDTTVRAIGAGQKKSVVARAKAREWAEKADDAKTPAARAKALSKVQSWRAKSAAAGKAWADGHKAGKVHREILIDTGTLKNSLFVTQSGNTVTVGTPVKYAAYHQFGAPAAIPSPGDRHHGGGRVRRRRTAGRQEPAQPDRQGT